MRTLLLFWFVGVAGCASQALPNRNEPALTCASGDEAAPASTFDFQGFAADLDSAVQRSFATTMARALPACPFSGKERPSDLAQRAVAQLLGVSAADTMLQEQIRCGGEGYASCGTMFQFHIYATDGGLAEAILPFIRQADENASEVEVTRWIARVAEASGALTMQGVRDGRLLGIAAQYASRTGEK